MARPPTPPILDQIHNANSYAEQLAALRALKNDLVGHQQRKASWIELGVVEPVLRLLATKDAETQLNGNAKLGSRNMTEAESVRWQALCVMGSLAYGGPAFMAPLHSASILPALLENLSPLRNPPKLVSASLQALSNLTASIYSTTVISTSSITFMADMLFSEPHILSLRQILSQSSTTADIQIQISLGASLVIRLCKEERHQKSLATAGIIDALASRLAGTIMSQGMATPGAELASPRQLGPNSTITSAPESADLAAILEAIATIIADSKYRASQFLYSDAIIAVLSSTTDLDIHPKKSARAAWDAFKSADLSTRQRQLSLVDLQIPAVPASQSRNPQALNFPLLGSSSSENLSQLAKYKNNMSQQTSTLNSGVNTPINDEVTESPLIAYLIWLAKEKLGLERLMAIFLLAVLYRVGLANKDREILIGRVIVPMLVQIIELGSKDIPLQQDPTATAELTAARWLYQERAPAVLAMLVVDSEYLQKTAFETGVIKKLSTMIKVAYEPVYASSMSEGWSPETLSDMNIDATDNPTTQMGHPGLPPLLVHRIKVRESTLGAIAALVPFKEEYRKALIEEGVVPYIVESLRVHPDKPTHKATDKLDKTSERTTVQPSSEVSGYGTNPTAVLIAACGAVRHLSRSVSILRTTFMDNGVVAPVFHLLQHTDIDVQIAATAAVCNLVTDFSPMRETISNAGVLKVLCQHAHSSNVKLRLNALWALKHLVLCADNDVKKICLEELGEGWLIQIISADTEEVIGSSNRSTSKFGFGAGEMDHGAPPGQIDGESDFTMTESVGALGQAKGSTIGFEMNAGVETSGQTGARLAMLRDLEASSGRRQSKDDIGVQEQGLEFIRNLIGHVNSVGPSETSEMIDHLFNALGRDRIFAILASKLRMKLIVPGPDKESETRVTRPHAEIVVAVGYILVHMAASIPRHRQQVIAQTELLRLVVQQFGHPSKEVRVALCWLVVNLTWMDDTPDGAACAQRAQKLKELGFLTKLENLQSDVELDVRERAKTAVFQMKQHGC